MRTTLLSDLRTHRRTCQYCRRGMLRTYAHITRYIPLFHGWDVGLSGLVPRFLEWGKDGTPQLGMACGALDASTQHMYMYRIICGSNALGVRVRRVHESVVDSLVGGGVVVVV